MEPTNYDPNAPNGNTPRRTGPFRADHPREGEWSPAGGAWMGVDKNGQQWVRWTWTGERTLELKSGSTLGIFPNRSYQQGSSAPPYYVRILIPVDAPDTAQTSGPPAFPIPNAEVTGLAPAGEHSPAGRSPEVHPGAAPARPAPVPLPPETGTGEYGQGPAATHPQHAAAPVHPQHAAAPVHPQSAAAPVHPQGTVAPVHPQGAVAPVHPQSAVAPVHPQGGAAPAHPQGGAAPAHPQGGAAPAHPQGGAAPVHPQGGAAAVHPQGGAAAVHPQGTAAPAPPANPYAPTPPAAHEPPPLETDGEPMPDDDIPGWVQAR